VFWQRCSLLALGLASFVACPWTTYALDPQQIPVPLDEKKIVDEAKPVLVPDPAAAEFAAIEASAIAFVNEHHRELGSLLQLLKSMKEQEYEAAIREINKNQRRLESIAKRDTEGHSIELEAWKIQSKIDLILARAVAQSRDADPDQLRKLIRKQYDIQKKRLRHERNVLSERQKTIKESLERMESQEEERIEQQLTNLSKRIRQKIDKNAKSKSEAGVAADSKKN
jgi:hypothetical protein